ncbi:phosphoglyceromutase [Hymenobacter sedentarius]|uniref:2,3-bisphosphoglycerate-dependent phosphoglycerate mutase n=1 Tax=Hymenobacter sedentarius TaxID=1411621 RepID=A0A0U3JSR7_9BACT|nr:2,3-diphosphoglycerate-dependent phosphoglycerate mutase [Hymenobacter sedentarius]ALW83711.1 phosphoglyceromutase [Hymenobacter sedentarius]
MALLVLVRHGESTANLANVFTGWLDVPLSSTGEAEAYAVADKLKDFHFDVAYTSTLIRAKRTLDIIVERAGWADLPVHHVDALKERMYGNLQGLNKAEVAIKYGQAQVDEWRRSYDVAPPNGESLKQTRARAVEFFEAEIAPQLRADKNVLIVSHGNTLRGLRMYLEHLSETQVVGLEIVTGGVHVYRFDAHLAIVEMYDL